MKNLPPIYVIDTSVICHNIKNVVTSSIVVDTQEKLNLAAQYAELALKWTNALGFLPHRPKSAVVIWVKDSKPYWRSQFNSQYKFGRSTPPTFFYSLLNYATKQYDSLGFAQYEADDVAALIYKMWLYKKDMYGGLNLITCDTDWMGFCSEGVTWIDTNGFEPRVRRKPEVKAWIERKQLRGTRLMKAFEIPKHFEARHLWDFKVASGDKSDNLEPGSPAYMIDLLNPHPEYTLWHNKSAISAAARYLTNTQDLDDPINLHFRMSRLGFNTPIKPIDTYPIAA